MATVYLEARCPPRTMARRSYPLVDTCVKFKRNDEGPDLADCGPSWSMILHSDITLRGMRVRPDPWGCELVRSPVIRRPLCWLCTRLDISQIDHQLILRGSLDRNDRPTETAGCTVRSRYVIRSRITAG